MIAPTEIRFPSYRCRPVIDRGDSSVNTYSFISGGSRPAEDEQCLMGVKRENERNEGGGGEKEGKK